MIDGAGHYTVFFKIMLPQAKPFITAIAITTFISQWNNYNTPFLYLDRYPTMALGLYDFQQKQLYGTQMSPLFAGIILSVLPVAVLFTAMQKPLWKTPLPAALKADFCGRKRFTKTKKHDRMKFALKLIVWGEFV